MKAEGKQKQHRGRILKEGGHGLHQQPVYKQTIITKVTNVVFKVLGMHINRRRTLVSNLHHQECSASEKKSIKIR